MSERLITVITPFYNSSECMNKPIESMLNQTYQNWEWICVDDCSTDDTLAKLQEIAKKDSRIKVIAKDKNGGNSASSLNYGIQYCTGTHVQLLGHDDKLSFDLLEKLVNKIDSTNADIIIPDAEIDNSAISPDIKNFKMIGIMDEKGWDNTSINRDIILTGKEAAEYSIGWRIHAWACFSTEILKNCGKVDEECNNGDEYYARIWFLNANKVVFSEGTYYYLRKKDSISNNFCVKYFDIFKTEEKLLKLVYKNKFKKNVILRCKKELLNRYTYYYIKYECNKDKFSDEEQKEIKQILQYASKLFYQYCLLSFPKECIKFFKYIMYVKVWRKLDKKLRRKGYIQ